MNKAIEDLQLKIDEDRLLYGKLTQKEQKDCQIKRLFREMHNWFVCMRNFKMSSEQLGKYWDEVRKDKEYLVKLDNYNKIYDRLESNHKKLYRAVTELGIINGRKYSKLTLLLCGFDKDFAEKNCR